MAFRTWQDAVDRAVSGHPVLKDYSRTVIDRISTQVKQRICEICWSSGLSLQDVPCGIAPNEHAEAMVTRFRTLLCEEISLMTDGGYKNHISTSSEQSIGSITASSIISGSTITSGAHDTPSRKGIHSSVMNYLKRIPNKFPEFKN